MYALRPFCNLGLNLTHNTRQFGGYYIFVTIVTLTTKAVRYFCVN